MKCFRTLRILPMAAIATSSVACGGAAKTDPVVRCAEFTFRVADDAQIKEARQLMHQAAIEMPGDFQDELPRWGVRSTISVPMSSSKFVLTSKDGPHRDRYQLTVLHIAGGTPTRTHNPGREGECTTEEIVSAFTKLRTKLLGRWGEQRAIQPVKAVGPEDRP